LRSHENGNGGGVAEGDGCGDVVHDGVDDVGAGSVVVVEEESEEAEHGRGAEVEVADRACVDVGG
jgi:hypothetical protein